MWAGQKFLILVPKEFSRMIEFIEVTKKFGETTALENISFKIESGEFVFIVGRSGSGKTTLMKLILRDYLPTSGNIRIGGLDLNDIPKKKIPEYRRRIGVVFQDFKLLPDQTVFENVALALKILGQKEPEIAEQVNEVLRSVGLEEKSDFFPAQLSAGELQRTCLARAVIGQPEIILADEPTGNLDLKTAHQIVDLLEKINETGKTVVMTTHNLEIIKRMKKRVIELDK